MPQSHTWQPLSVCAVRTLLGVDQKILSIMSHLDITSNHRGASLNEHAYIADLMFCHGHG